MAAVGATGAMRCWPISIAGPPGAAPEACREAMSDKPGEESNPIIAAHRAPPRRIDSRILLQSADRVEIEHKGEIYILRVTRRDKLILTK